MAYSRIESGHGRILILAMEHDFPAKMEEWKEHLKLGRMTPEMRSVFAAMGYPVPRQRVEKKAEPIEEATPESVARQEAEAVEKMDGVVRFAHGDEPLSDYEPDPGSGIFGRTRA